MSNLLSGVDHLRERVQDVEPESHTGIKWAAIRFVYMDNPLKGILGVQITLVGVLLGTLFREVPPYDLLAVLLGAVGTMVVLAAVFDM